MKIAVAGTGYVGLSISVLLAQSNEVTAVDIIQEKVDMINNGKSPIVDKEIELAGDEFFVLGDDRQNSEDSRMADIGNVKRSYIYGKVWFVVSPGNNFGFVRS